MARITIVFNGTEYRENVNDLNELAADIRKVAAGNKVRAYDATTRRYVTATWKPTEEEHTIVLQQVAKAG